MSRLTLSLALVAALALPLRAEEPAATKKSAVPATKKGRPLPPEPTEEPGKLEKPKPKPGEKPARPDGPNEAEQALERIARNTAEAGKKLADKDTGDQTRDLQRKILEDIDKLLQKQKQPPMDPQNGEQPPMPMDGSDPQPRENDPSGAGSPSGQPKPMSSPGNAGGKPMPNPGGAGQKPQSNPSADGAGERKPEGGLSRRERRLQAAGKQPGGKDPMTAKGGTGRKPGEKDPMKEPGAGNGGPMKPGDEVGKGENPVGGKPGEDEKRRAELGRLAEVYKDTWGHLPETLRQEMDLYYREQFMPRYSDLLKQYYASLAERKGRTRE